MRKYEDRPGRNLREKLIQTIQDRFRQHKNETLEVSVNTLREAKIEIDALKQLTSNFYNTTVGLSYSSSVRMIFSVPCEISHFGSKVVPESSENVIDKESR